MKQMMKRTGLMTLMIVCSVPCVYAAENPWQASYSLERKGMYQEAIEQIEKVSHSSVNDELLSLRLGWLYYLQGDYNDAKRAYENALEENVQSVDARLGIYNQLVAQKRWREADKYNQETLVITPSHLQANLNQMAIEAHHQDWKSLSKRASKMVRNFPTSADSLIYLARANKGLGNKSSARRAYEKVLMLYPSNLEAAYYLSNNK